MALPQCRHSDEKKSMKTESMYLQHSSSIHSIFHLVRQIMCTPIQHKRHKTDHKQFFRSVLHSLMAVVALPGREQPSAHFFLVSTSMFWSKHLYNRHLELSKDSFLTVIFITKCLGSEKLMSYILYTDTRGKQKLQEEMAEENR